MASPTTQDPREIAAKLMREDEIRIAAMAAVHPTADGEADHVLPSVDAVRLRRLGIVSASSERRRERIVRFTPLGRAVAAILAEGTVTRG